MGVRGAFLAAARVVVVVLWEAAAVAPITTCKAEVAGEEPRMVGTAAADVEIMAVVAGTAGGGGGGGGGNGGGGGGRGGRFNFSPEQMEKMQAFRDTTTQLRTSAEASLGKILDKKQVLRLKQIQLQLDPAGPWIVLREDMIEKLNLTEEQVAQLTRCATGSGRSSGTCARRTAIRWTP